MLFGLFCCAKNAIFSLLPLSPSFCLFWRKNNFGILADQLTLFQPRGTDYAHLITIGTPWFSDLPSALLWPQMQASKLTILYTTYVLISLLYSLKFMVAKSTLIISFLLFQALKYMWMMFFTQTYNNSGPWGTKTNTNWRTADNI